MNEHPQEQTPRHSLTPERAREIGRKGGLATVEKHGRAHMSTIGKAGFAATMLRHGGAVVWKHLQPTYRAATGRDEPRRQLTREEYKKREKVRAAARKLYPDLTCDFQIPTQGRCGAPAQRHHVHGCDIPDANDHVIGYCQPHHALIERTRRYSQWELTEDEREALAFRRACSQEDARSDPAGLYR